MFALANISDEHRFEDQPQRESRIDRARILIPRPILNWNPSGLAQFRVLTSKLVFTQVGVNGRQEVIHLEVEYEAGRILKL